MGQSAHSPALLDTATVAGLEGARVAIVHTHWNSAIVAEQTRGAARILEQHGAQIAHTLVVPGAVEIPFGCRLAAQAQGVEAIIAFGAVIRGGTPHFDYVCKAVTEGILQLNLTLPIPTIFGVLTLDTEAQAWERLGGEHGHKGEEAAMAALQMIALQRSVRPQF